MYEWEKKLDIVDGFVVKFPGGCLSILLICIAMSHPMPMFWLTRCWPFNVVKNSFFL